MDAGLCAQRKLEAAAVYSCQCAARMAARDDDAVMVNIITTPDVRTLGVIHDSEGAVLTGWFCCKEMPPVPGHRGRYYNNDPAAAKAGRKTM